MDLIQKGRGGPQESEGRSGREEAGRGNSALICQGPSRHRCGPALPLGLLVPPGGAQSHGPSTQDPAASYWQCQDLNPNLPYEKTVYFLLYLFF